MKRPGANRVKVVQVHAPIKLGSVEVTLRNSSRFQSTTFQGDDIF